MSLLRKQESRPFVILRRRFVILSFGEESPWLHSEGDPSENLHPPRSPLPSREGLIMNKILEGPKVFLATPGQKYRVPRNSSRGILARDLHFGMTDNKLGMTETG